MFGAVFKGTGGAFLAVGLVVVLVAAVGAGFAYTDEQDNQDQRCSLLRCDGPDRDRSEMNFGVLEAAYALGTLGLLAVVLGILILAIGGGVDKEEEHRRRMREAKVGKDDA